MIKPLVMLSNDAAASRASTDTAATASSMGGMQILDIIIIATCAYLFFCGIVGKGSLYKDDQIHPSRKADYFKAMRIFALVAGPVGVLSIVVERFVNPTLGFVMTGIFLAMIVAICVVIWPMNAERVKKKEGKAPPKK